MAAPPPKKMLDPVRASMKSIGQIGNVYGTDEGDEETEIARKKAQQAAADAKTKGSTYQQQLAGKAASQASADAMTRARGKQGAKY